MRSARPTLAWFRGRGRWFTDRRGAVAVLGALSMTTLVGLTGMAVDLGIAYVQRTRLQKTADSAAMAGAISWVKTGSTTAVIATINDVVVANGFAASVIQQPSNAYLATSPKTAADHAIQVSLATTSALTFSKAIVELGVAVDLGLFGGSDRLLHDTGLPAVSDDADGEWRDQRPRLHCRGKLDRQPCHHCQRRRQHHRGQHRYAGQHHQHRHNHRHDQDRRHGGNQPL